MEERKAYAVPCSVGFPFLMEENMEAIFDIFKSIYKGAFGIWNFFISLAVTLFTTSPKAAASGSLYATAHTFYNTVITVTVPLATVFFIIAVYKEVIGSPPEQQARRFMQDAFKYVIILYISTQLWTIMGYVVDFSDGLTDSLSVSVDECKIDVEHSDIYTMIDNVKRETDTERGEFLTDPESYLTKVMSSMVCFVILLFGSLISILVMAACGLSITNIAFQRIIKPLVIMPFGAIVLGIGSCAGEGTRMMWHYGKTLLSLCISGAFMVLAVKLGIKLTTTAIAFDVTSTNVVSTTVLMTVQTNVAAIVITGLCKAMDSLVSRVFG